MSFLPFVNMMRNEAWPADSLLDYYDTFVRTAIQATPFKFNFDYPFTVRHAPPPLYFCYI